MSEYKFDIMNDRYINKNTGAIVDGKVMDQSRESTNRQDRKLDVERMVTMKTHGSEKKSALADALSILID